MATVDISAAEDASGPEVMMSYYKRLYPFKPIFTWLNRQHAPSRAFTHREFAFTLAGDVYLRYNSFSNAEDLKRQVIRLNPSRFEIGAVYNARPRDKKTLRAGALAPIQRELVFDIDMTDYDEIRTCCSGKGICRRCWGFIASAVKVMDAALRDQFGFKYMLWVYSGRRGIHCWISDEEAMNLTDEQRKAVMGWLEVIKGGKDMAKKVNVRIPGRHGLHPSLRSALSILKNDFTGLILDDQDCFAVEEQWNVLLELIPDKEAGHALRKKWSGNSERSSADKWEDIKTELKRRAKVKESVDQHPIMLAMEDIILQYTYPRLDAEVSKHRNHLLKAPFCVHPATGRVCVPVDPLKVDEFVPEKVPTVGQLLRELNEAKASAATAAVEGDAAPMEEDGPNASTPDGEHYSDWEGTSLKPYVEMLNQHVLGLLDETRRVKREMKGEPSTDF